MTRARGAAPSETVREYYFYRSDSKVVAAITERANGPLEPWFNKTWRPGEIELAK